MTALKYYPLVLAGFLLCFQAFGQDPNNPESRPLRLILQETEQKFDVSFSYADSILVNLSCKTPDYSQSLDAVLQYISSETKLVFEKIDDRFIAIKRAPDKKPELVRICGKLMDRISGEPIPFASIVAGDKFTTSDSNGNFQMEVQADAIIQIRSLGYIAFEGSADSLTSCNPVQLTPSVTTLDEIVIREYLTAGIDLTAGGIYKVSGQRLGMLPGLIDPDVLQSIQTLPGIQSVQELVSDINIRGGTHDQNLILWDHIRMYQTGHFFGLITSFNPYLTNEVSLIQNGTPSWYSDGVSGTLDIRTENTIADEFSGGAGINMISGDVFAHVPIIPNKLSVLLSARRSIADLVRSPTYRSYYERAFQNSDITGGSDTSLVSKQEDFVFNDISVKILANPDKKTPIRINFMRAANEISYEESALVGNEQETRISGLNQQSTALGLDVSRNITGDLTLRGRMYYSSYSLGATNNDIFNNQRLIQENDVLDTGLKFDLRYALNPNLLLEAGYHFTEVGVSNLEDLNNPEFRRYVKRVLRTHAGYADITYQSSSKNTWLRAGGRVNYLDKFNRWIPEPRFSFRQKIYGQLFLEIAGERKSQTLAQVIDYQTDFLGVEKRRWILANDGDIPVIIGSQASAGVQFKTDNFIVRTSAYYKYVEGVTTASQGFQNEYQFDRISGEYEVRGVDVLLNYRRENWNSWITYTLGENTFSSDSLSPSSFPNTLDIRHTVSSGLSFETTSIKIAAGINWHSGKPYSRPVEIGPARQITFESVNNSRLDYYLRLDASAAYKFSLGGKVRAETGISVWNILDRTNTANIFYRVDDNDQIEEIRQNALGFTPNVMFRIYF
ncbi:TonB-dependent receptor [Fulvivirga sedimenti]|uniref:TonB-dependent receptor n=1 Tax=Fulvivirga sedimenti TaxID=2879465 RepID=A0A9X1HMD7_9BACT|nr:TonB-dependent receptor plug domain-containing protein [Fulvivirga sedimenti]MCA6074526.1 TonB-dependent receptor [Fulvivirga sedimenti]MCA6075703.1 TonB-dependent receptor [Fulvivirga sedimenti]MCA6076831.1 TonB-dependent receptor [Fulvivirga sedimenti]